MRLSFYKYQGTGNDFILVDNREDVFPKSNTELVAKLCSRRMGIGADGLILLENDPTSDFKMIYFNADGREGSMCGNGGRCIVAFAEFLGIIAQETTFLATDGEHFARINNDIVELHMADVEEIREKPNAITLNTGSPHHVQIVPQLEQYDVVKEGAKLRYGLYGENGSNINFVEQIDDATFYVRTYERGVENETLSCGTGVTAVALAMHHSGITSNKEIKIKTLGGELTISFQKSDGKYCDVYLTGPAQQVYKGEITC